MSHAVAVGRVPAGALVLRRQRTRVSLGGLRLQFVDILRILVVFAVGLSLVLFLVGPGLFVGISALCGCAIVFLGAYLWIAQPLACIYLTPSMVGHRTGFGSRYEVERAAVSQIRLRTVAVFGIPQGVIDFQSTDGKTLLRHYQSAYAYGELEGLATALGVDLLDDRP